MPPTGGLAGGTPLRTPMPEGAAALRVFVEEVRAAAQAQLSGAARADALPPLADADPGNAVAALLRWLRAASAGAPLSPATLQKIVEDAYARAIDQLQRDGGVPVRGAVAEPPRGPRGAVPGDAPRPAGPASTPVPPGSADASALVRETLATARDLVLRALLTSGDARATPAAAGAEGSASRAQDATAGGTVPTSNREQSGGAFATRSPAGAPGGEPRGHVAAAALGGIAPAAARGSAVGATLGPAAAAIVTSTSRVPPVDAPTLLRTFVDEIRLELGRTVGATRLPSAPLPLVTDAHGAQLGPALLRWLTSAVAEKGVPLAPLQDAVRAAHGRAAAALPPLEPGSTPGALPAARDALLAVRDHVLRGLGVTPDRLEGTASREAAGPRGEARADLPIGDPRGVPVSAGALVPLEERVEEIDARRRSRGGEPRADDDEDATAPDARLAPNDLQGPMDCIRRYFDAYLAGDSTGYAAQWVYPACVWSGGRWSAYANAAACAQGNDEYTRKARGEGIVGGRVVMLRVEPTTEDVAVVHAVFERERADGTLAGETETAYTTVRTEAGWRVAVCVVKK
jgi:hypothetical protein